MVDSGEMSPRKQSIILTGLAVACLAAVAAVVAPGSRTPQGAAPPEGARERISAETLYVGPRVPVEVAPTDPGRSEGRNEAASPAEPAENDS